MQFNPSKNEINALNHMPTEERLQYFITRTMETEEIWGMQDTSGWLLKERDEQTVLPVWPYKQFSQDYILYIEKAYHSAAMSLDYFIHNVLLSMLDQGIDVLMLPTHNHPGHLLNAGKLYEIYESMMDAGDYHMEG